MSFAQALLGDLDGLAWPDQVKAMQRNWIGKATGAFFDFPIMGKNDKQVTSCYYFGYFITI